MATVPLFQGNIGAIQASKGVSNADRNLLTECQQMELLCDRILQTHRLAVGGLECIQLRHSDNTKIPKF